MSVESALRVVKEWNQCHGAFYLVDDSDLTWNLSAQSWLNYQVASLAGVPALLASASNEGIAAGISAKTLWLSLYGKIPTGKETEFVEAFLAKAKAEGKTRAHVGGEEFHFVAGVPTDGPAGVRLAAAFSSAGFTGSDAADFGGPLHSTKLAKYISEAEAAAAKLGCSLAEASAKEDFLELHAFLLKEFPGRWEREYRCWQSRSDTKRAYWNLLRDSKKTVIGFSRLAIRGRLMPLTSGWTPGALRLPLDSDNPSHAHLDSCLGPIGIAATERGRGAGKILLGLSLQSLLVNKADRVCIDWTDAYNYYIPLGVEYLRKFRNTWKDL
ncbi:MAG: hypothetical protein ACXWQJ_11725 [Bdellovibrionota bacterium]